MEEPQRKVVVCPLCAKAVTYFPEAESADAAVDRHTARDCDPANYGRVHKKRRCPVPGCKERLTATNVYRCRDCSMEVCMRHRYNAADHACVGKPAPGPSAAARRQLGSLLRGLRMTDAADAVSQPTASARPAAAAVAGRQTATHTGSRSPKTAGSGSGSGSGGGSGFFSRAAAALQGWRSNPTSVQADPSNSVRGSAARRQQQQQQQSSAAAKASARQQQAALSPIEVCADCGAHFDTIGELIAHAEARHLEAR